MYCLIEAVETESLQVLMTDLSIQRVSYMERSNLWVGPREVSEHEELFIIVSLCVDIQRDHPL